MRRRVKMCRKLLTFYKNNFGIHPPYTVVVDGTFCKSALKFKINIGEQMPKYLEAEVKLVTTSCVIAECEAFGTLLYGPLKILKQYHVINCFHKTPVPAAKCIRSLVKKRNKRELMIATQDNDLREKLKQKAGLPIFYMAYNAINLEELSDVSKGSADQKLQKKIAPSEHELEVLKKLKVETFGEQPEKKKFKRKGPKGPNPLSCKKKKKKVEKNPKKSFIESAVKKRQRQRNRNRAKKLTHTGTDGGS